MKKYGKGLGSGWHFCSSGHRLARLGIKTKRNIDYSKGYKKDNVTIIGFVARKDNKKPSALIMAKYDKHKRVYVYKGKFTGIKDEDNLIKKIHGVEKRYKFTGLPLREGSRDVMLAPKLKLRIRHQTSPYGIYTNPKIVR